MELSKTTKIGLAALAALGAAVWVSTYAFVAEFYIKPEKIEAREQTLAEETARQEREREEAELHREIHRAFASRGLSWEAAETLWRESKKYSINPRLALAVAKVESNLSPALVSHNTDGSIDRGLFQINSRSEAWLASKAGLNKHDPFNPEDSIKMGLWYLSYLKQRLSDEHSILTAYNRGETGLKNYVAANGTPVSDYSRAVMSRAWQ